jgi:hypothetical protein
MMIDSYRNEQGMFIDNVGPFDYTITRDTELIDVTSLGDTLEIDPEWFHIDEKGHFHAFNVDTQLTPTLKHVTETINDISGFDVVTSEHHCIICNAVVTPNYVFRDSPLRKTVAGPTTTKFTIDRYTHYASLGQQVSFYSGLMFGFARITHVHVNSERMESLRFRVEFTCQFLARRGSSGDL